MTYPTYELTLHKTYYEKGFFNLGVEIERYITKEEGDITLILGTHSHKLIGRVTRTVNKNLTPRVFGGAQLRDWFFANFHMNDSIRVVVQKPNELTLLPAA